MQTTINEMIETNKFIHQQAYDRLSEINVELHDDLTHLMTIGQSLPAELSNHDKTELQKIVNKMEIRSKVFAGDVDKHEAAMSEMERKVKSVIQSLGVPQGIKGALLTARNNLENNMFTYVNEIRSGVEQLRAQLFQFDDMIRELKNIVGMNSDEKEQIKKIVKELMSEEIENLKKNMCSLIPKCNAEANYSQICGDICETKDKLNVNQNTLNSYKTYFDQTISKLSKDVKQINAIVDSIKNNVGNHKNQLQTISSQVEMDLNELKQDMLNKMKNIDRNVGSQLKRY